MTGSNERLERRYRRLLRLYPSSYREQHGDDMLGVLMDGADGAKGRPGFMETLDLLHGALTVHALCIALHLLLASRAASHQWPPSGGPATR